MSGNSFGLGRTGTERFSAALGVVAFSCGAIILYWLSELPPLLVVLASFITPFCILVRTRSHSLRRVALIGVIFCGGMAWSAWHATERLGERLPPEMEGIAVSVSGYVCNVPEPGSFHSLKFRFCVTRWHDGDEFQRLPQTLRLAWYNADARWLPDHRLRLSVVLKRPHGSLNPEGFRYENWLYRNGYRATGSVREVQVDPSVPCGLRCQYASAHGRLVRWVQEVFSDARHGSMVASLLVGYRGDLEPQQWTLLRSTGTIHLVAISGLHIGLVALGATLVFGFLVRNLPACWLTEASRRRWIFGAVAVSSVLYAFAAGFTVPTRRALIMVLVVGWSLLLARKNSIWQPLIYALGMVLLLDPFAPLDPGFWLSFTAVAVLVWMFAGRLRRPGWLISLLLAQTAVFAGLWPALVLVGQGQPLAGAMANLYAIPWVSAVVMPLLAISSLFAAVIPSSVNVFLPLLDGALELFWQWLSFVAAQPFPVLRPSLLGIVLFAFMVMATLVTPWRAVICVAGLTGLLWLTTGYSKAGNPMVSQPEVRVWDVGQGLSILVRHQDQVLLYDTGPEVPDVFSAVDSVLLPNLLALGVSRIDRLVISHADNDHAGGLRSLANAVELGEVVSGEPEEVQRKLGAGVSVVTCEESRITVGDLLVDLWRSPHGREGNDASCVLRVRTSDGQFAWLLPGDIGKKTEQEYLAYSAARGLDSSQAGVRVMIAPHHGSKTSSSRDWIAQTRPSVVIFSAGYRHRFGHPHPTVTGRYREFGAELFNTACSGALIMTATEAGLEIEEAQHRAPFWISAEGQTRQSCKIP